MGFFEFRPLHNHLLHLFCPLWRIAVGYHQRAVFSARKSLNYHVYQFNQSFLGAYALTFLDNDSLLRRHDWFDIQGGCP